MKSIKEEIEDFENISIEDFISRVEKKDFTEVEIMLIERGDIKCLSFVGRYPETELDRWSRDVFTVYQDETSDRYFGINWSEGLTENQENSFDKQPVEIHRKKEEIIVDVWSPVNKEADFIKIMRLEEGF